jgi:hypothetical protein
VVDPLEGQKAVSRDQHGGTQPSKSCIDRTNSEIHGELRTAVRPGFVKSEA